MKLSKYKIVPMSVDDVESADRMRYQSWLDTYVDATGDLTKEFVDAKFLPMFTPDGLLIQRKKILKKLNDDHINVLVAKSPDGKVVGQLIAVKDNRKNEILRLYTDKAYHGSGLGRELMEKGLTWIGINEDIYLGVAENNKRARNFYHKFGFVETGNSYINHLPKMREQEMIRRAKNA
ncbi:GNAT family N-acetyltransferase [Candidatus Saccharibacteria bacterium]|nr:GNAT family N-acetyltransferase [Candidatus Saccharibacteria bacterium]